MEFHHHHTSVAAFSSDCQHSFHSEVLLPHPACPGHGRASSREVLDTTFFLGAMIFQSTKLFEQGKGMLRTQRIFVFPIHYFRPVCLRWTWVLNIPLWQIFNGFHRLQKNLQKLSWNSWSSAKQPPNIWKERNPKLCSTSLQLHITVHFFYSLIMFVNKGY